MTKTVKTAAAKITGLRTAKPADKRGPKAGSAMSNQSAREAAPKINPDTIVAVAGQRSGPPTRIVETKKADGTPGKCVAIPQHAFVGELTKLAVVGGSLKAVEAYIATHKPTAKLATGITSRDAPHASKAVGDQRAAPVKADRTVKAAKTKARAPGGDRTYVVTGTNNAKPDSWRHHMLAMIMACTSTEAAKAKHAKSGKFVGNKLDFNWTAASGFIKFN
jgi:hypothetical protein